MRPIEARFASQSLVEKRSPYDELAKSPHWNIGAAPGTTGEHHVVITPKHGLIGEIRTASPGLIEDVAREFLLRENAVLIYAQNTQLRFDLYTLPQNYLPVETIIRSERVLQDPQALSAISKGMRDATTAQGLWDSAELLSPEETHKTFSSEIVGLVFAMQQKIDKNTQEKKPFTPEDVSDLMRDIDSAYNEVYEDAQEAKISNHEEEPVFISPKAEGRDWQADFQYLTPNRTQPHEVPKEPDYSNLLTEIVPSYNITLFKKGENIFVVFHPQLEPADALPTSLPSHGDIFTQVNAILHQQNPPLAA